MIDAVEQRSHEDMSKIPTKKVTIDVPIPEYETLKDLADEKGTSIRGLVREGVNLIIVENNDLLITMAEKANKDAKAKSDNILGVLSTLKRQ